MNSRNRTYITPAGAWIILSLLFLFGLTACVNGTPVQPDATPLDCNEIIDAGIGQIHVATFAAYCTPGLTRTRRKQSKKRKPSSKPPEPYTLTLSGPQGDWPIRPRRWR